jgi:hypothetical protein
MRIGRRFEVAAPEWRQRGPLEPTHGRPSAQHEAFFRRVVDVGLAALLSLGPHGLNAEVLPRLTCSGFSTTPSKSRRCFRALAQPYRPHPNQRRSHQTSVAPAMALFSREQVPGVRAPPPRAAQLGHLDERPQLIEIEAAHPPSRRQHAQGWGLHSSNIGRHQPETFLRHSPSSHAAD